MLERDYGIGLSGGSTARMPIKLNKRGLMRLKESKLKKKLKPNELNNAKERNFSKSYSQKWSYEKHHISNKKNIKHNNIDKLKPGELMQIDRLKINKNNLRFIEFSTVDPIARHKASHRYGGPNGKNAKDFLINKLLKQSPFKVTSIQADGGSEFRKHFEDACEELNISPRVSPPHSPKRNGRIERSDRTIREEFYNINKLMGYRGAMGDFNAELEKYTHKYNNYRPHEELDFLTPREYSSKLTETGGFAPNMSGL
jgi:hypothetical protein